MFQFNNLSDFQYARLKKVAVHLHFGMFWSSGIPTMIWYATCSSEKQLVEWKKGQMCILTVLNSRWY